jgi:ArsR family transcriptional regulator
MNSRAPEILDRMASLADTTRSRILLLLDRHELTVTELCGITQLPQSTVSRHLKALADAGWVAARGEGTSNLYSLTRDDLDAPARKLWQIVRDQVGASTAAAQDQRRLSTVLAERRTKSQEFFSSSAGQWDRVRDEMFGDRFHLAALGAFADPAWTIGDLGCGTGQVSAALAPFVTRVIGVDGSAAMLQAARKRLQPFENVELRRGELESLPIDDERLDAATLMLVLHHVPEPDRALAEVARVVRPGGRVVVVDMLPHDRDNYRQQMGHVWLGFSDEHVRTLIGAAGFEDIRVVALAPDPRAKGPALFVAAGIKKQSSHS